MDIKTKIDYNLAIIPYFAEILVDDKSSNHVKEIRFNGLKRLQSQIEFYKSRGFVDFLLYNIAQKKGKMIMKTTSQTEMEQLLKPHCPHFDGNEFLPDKYNVPEEELICWSETSMLAPLNEYAYRRMMKVFGEVFPKEKESILSAKENKRIEKLQRNAVIKKEKLIKKAETKARNRILNEPPHRSVLEEIGNSVTHGIGAIFAIVALILMLLKSDSGYKIAGSLVYGISMFLMMLDSCLYHSWPTGSKVKRIYRRFDYSSIYLLIGGTFSPMFLVYAEQPLGIILFAIQWAIIITGITFIAIFGPGRLKWLHFPMYLIIGWSGLAFIPSLAKNNLPLMLFILIGGVVYSLGIIPFVKKKVKGAHFIWHFFVLAGAITQFLGIYIYLY